MVTMLHPNFFLIVAGIKLKIKIHHSQVTSRINKYLQCFRQLPVIAFVFIDIYYYYYFFLHISYISPVLNVETMTTAHCHTPQDVFAGIMEKK